MNIRTATTVATTALLAALLSSCAEAAAGTPGVTELGLARGHVVEFEDRPFAPSRQSFVSPAEARAWSSGAMREFHAQRPSERTSGTPWTSEVRRELTGSAPHPVEQSFTAEVLRELKGSGPRPVEQPFTAEARRELKGSEPRQVEQPFTAEVWRELKGSTDRADDR